MGNQEIQNFLTEQEKTGIWIGAHQQEGEEDWRWSDCTPWNWTMWDLDFPYGQQPDQPGIENCIMIWYSDTFEGWYDKWHDVRCDLTHTHGRQLSFVCSKNICQDTVTTTTTIESEKKGNLLHHNPVF